MTMMRRFVNNKYQETLYFLLEAIFTTGCGFWWTYPQMAIGAILSIIATTMQLIYRDKKTEKKGYQYDAVDFCSVFSGAGVENRRSVVKNMW